MPSMKPDAYFPFYFNEFFAAVRAYRHRPFVALAYLTAMSHYWGVEHCEGLDDDDASLRSICELSLPEWSIAKPVIFGKWFQLQDGKWHQKRCLEEWQKAVELYESRVRGAKETNARRSAKRHAKRNASDTDSVTQ